MLAIGWLTLSVVLTVLLTSWVTFTATRLDRLHARVDAAQAALDAQLVRRAAAVQHVADSARSELGGERADRIAADAHAALSVAQDERERLENAVGKAANELANIALTLPRRLDAALAEVAESATRVIIARRFYNDAVRDTRALRTGRMPRVLRLAGRRGLPEFFDIDDASGWALRRPTVTARSTEAHS